MTIAVTAADQASPQSARRLFVPFSEPLLELLDRQGQVQGIAQALVPFHLEYECVRLMDGTFDFRQPLQEG